MAEDTKEGFSLEAELQRKLSPKEIQGEVQTLISDVKYDTITWNKKQETRSNGSVVEVRTSPEPGFDRKNPWPPRTTVSIETNPDGEDVAIVIQRDYCDPEKGEIEDSTFIGYIRDASPLVDFMGSKSGPTGISRSWATEPDLTNTRGAIDAGKELLLKA